MHLATRLFSISIFILTCSCFAQCKKNNNASISDNPYGLPNATQTGAGAFACRINGENFIARNDIDHINGVLRNDTIGIGGSFLVGNFFDIISIGIYGNLKAGSVYGFSDTIHTSCLFGTDSTCQAIVSVTTIYPRIGSIILTKLDTINKIISGTFNIKIPIPQCDTLNVTDGRFDYQYN